MSGGESAGKETAGAIRRRGDGTEGRREGTNEWDEWMRGGRKAVCVRMCRVCVIMGGHVLSCYLLVAPDKIIKCPFK